MRIRFFGSPDCNDCLKIFVLLNKYLVDYDYIDAEEEDSQDFCDEQNIYELPHVQFLDDAGEIIMEHIGPINNKKFENYLTKYFSDY